MKLTRVGQIITRGDRRWLIRVYLGRDQVEGLRAVRFEQELTITDSSQVGLPEGAVP